MNPPPQTRFPRRTWPLSRQWFSVFLLALGMASISLACKPPHSNPSKAKDAHKSVSATGVGNFQAWVLPRDERDPHLPSRSPERASQSTRKFIQQDGNVVFSEVVVLSPPAKDARHGEEAFLVWEDSVFGERITHAFYTYEKQDSGNRQPEKGTRQNVSQDKDTGRWFIPLVEAVGMAPEEMDPSETHWFILELHHAQGEARTLRVGIRIRGPFPKMVVNTYLPNLSEMLSSGSQRVYARIGITNPSRRFLDLRVEGGKSRFQYDSAVRYSQPGVQHITAQFGIDSSAVGTRHYRTRGDFVASAIRVERIGPTGARHEFPEFNSQGQFNIRVAPGELVYIAWLLTPDQGTYICTFPATTSAQAPQQASRELLSTLGIISNIPPPPPPAEKWEVIGVRLQPLSPNQVAIVDGWETQSLVDFTPEDKGQDSWAHQAGAVDLGWPLYPHCSGVF